MHGIIVRERARSERMRRIVGGLNAAAIIKYNFFRAAYYATRPFAHVFAPPDPLFSSPAPPLGTLRHETADAAVK